MFYLSANTIIGLGLGDIVPLSDKMRLAVAIQSLLGLIMMGIFLSVIVDRIRP